MNERLNPEQQEQIETLKYWIQIKRDNELAVEVAENNIEYLSQVITRFFVEVEDDKSE